MNDWRHYAAGIIFGLLVIMILLSSAVLAQETLTISPGEPVEAALSEAPNTVRYQFEGHIGDQANVSLTSRDFDPLLQVESPDGDVIAENDDSGGSLNSRIESLALPADGTYTIVVTSADGNGSGEYQLSLDLTLLSALEYGDTIAGEINETEKSIRYRFEGEQGDVISILMTAPEFDSFLTLANSDNDLISDDDSGGNLNAMIAGYVLPESGTYFITARPLNEFTTGPFSVALNKVEARTIAYNSTNSDEMNGEPLYYRFSAVSGDMIDVQLSSEDNLDLLFVIRSPEGYPVFFDDDSGAGFLPEVIDLLIEHDGDHMLVIQPLGTNQRGSFTVTLTARVPEVASMDELLSAEFGDKYRRRAYEFEVESLGTYRITATPDTGNVSNLVISAIQDGSVINSSSGIPTDESLTFDIEIHPGTLRIVVADYSLIQRQVSVIIEPVADIDEG